MVEVGGHAFKGYDEALSEIIGGISDMSDHVDELLVLLEQAFEEATPDFAQAKAMDKAINKLEYSIIDQLHFILQRYTPSFQELWFLTSLNKVAASLEGIGDLAKRSIRSCAKLPNGFPKEKRADVLDLLEMARSMLKDALENLRTYHPESAADIVKTEQQVSEKSSNLRYAILEEATHSETALQDEHRMLNLVRDIERLAENAMDILRMAFFAHTGERFKRKRALEADEE